MQVMKVTFWEDDMRQPASGSVTRDDTGGAGWRDSVDGKASGERGGRA